MVLNIFRNKILLNVCPECFVFDAYWGRDSDWPITDSVSESELLSSSEVLSEGLEGLQRLDRGGLDSSFLGRVFWGLPFGLWELSFARRKLRLTIYIVHF